MIVKIKSWCEGLTITIFIVILIEMLVPNGNNKKYVKVITGIYILYVMLNPILEFLGNNPDLNFLEKYHFEETYMDISDDIKDIYVLGIEESIKEELGNNGIEILDVEIITDSKYENIQRINLEVGNNERNNDIYEYLEKNFFINKINIDIRSRDD